MLIGSIILYIPESLTASGEGGEANSRAGHQECAHQRIRNLADAIRLCASRVLIHDWPPRSENFFFSPNPMIVSF